MYYDIYNLLLQHIYGNPEILTADMNLVLTLCATIGSLFVISVPFMIVWKVIKVICS